MKFLPPPVLAAMTAALLLSGAGHTPAAAFVAPFGEQAMPPQAETIQFFDRRGRRDERWRGGRPRIEPFRPPPPGRNNEIILERRPQRQQEQDRALDAVRRGEVLPLAGIIRSAQRYCPGTFLDASLRRRGNTLAYQVAILRPSGRRVVLLVDAASGAILGGQCR